VRYLLQVCADVPDAVEALRGLPCHMAYNLTLVDREGRHATALMSPDRPPIVQDARFATNHQIGVEWPRHARLSQTLERAEYLARELQVPGLDGAGLRRRFLAPPLHRRRYALGFGTVYTATYRPAAGAMRLDWPGLAPWPKSFAAFPEDARRIIYPPAAAPREIAPGPVHDARRHAGATRGVPQ
jgi:predicted choloylglycine hydrolase